MKTHHFFSVSIGICLFALMSCNDDQLVTTNADPQVEAQIIDDGIIYPLSNDFKNLFTKSNENSFETNWENWDKILTSKQDEISLPWAANSTGSVPADLAFDIKKEDGWKMLFHTLTNTTDLGLYAVFYNQRSGIMKVFYYEPTNERNNSAAWYLSFVSPQTWLNMGAEVAIPTNLGQLKSWVCTNAVNHLSKGIINGWNCFQVPLAYNPTNSGSQYIEMYSESSNIADVNLFGTGNAYSQGTILTYGSNNASPSLNVSIGSIFGNNAENYIDNSITQTNRAISAAVIIKAAKAFGKLTGLLNRKPTVTRSDLEFTTRSEFQVTGAITQLSTNQVKSIRAQFTEDRVGKVGAWNLSEQPTVYLDPRADYAPDIPHTDIGEHTFRLREPTRYSYNLVINPELQSHIKSQRVEISFVRYWARNTDTFYPEIPDCYTNFGKLGTTFGGFSKVFTTENILYGSHNEGKTIFDFPFTNMTFIAVNGYHDLHESNTPVVFIPTVICYGQKLVGLEGVYMRVSLYLETEFEGKRETTISTRTFLPKLEWDPDIYNQYRNLTIASEAEDADASSEMNTGEEYRGSIKLIDEQHPEGQIIEEYKK